MIASLHYTAILNDVNDIAVPDGAKTMSDSDCRSVCGCEIRSKYPKLMEQAHRPLLALSSAICTAISDSASNALVASAG
jgi:hypothetical protein